MKQEKEIKVTVICSSKEEMKAMIEAFKNMAAKAIESVEKDDSDQPEPKAFQPKEGDICACVFDEGIDSIFRYDGKSRTDEDGDVWLDGDLALALSEDVLKPYMIVYGEGSEHLRDRCRLANEEELTLFNAKVKEFEGAKKDADWVARKGDVYYTPSFDHNDGTFESVREEWEGTRMEVSTKRRGWTSRTEEECQSLCDKLNEAIKNVKP